jgi:LEA14-like dessication related protein
MEIKKKYIIAGVIGAITIAGALAYLQYKKMMNYVIKFKGVKVKTLSFASLDFDVFINFENKSDLKFIIKSQSYSVYINDIFVTKIQNASPVMIKAKAFSIIGLNVKLNPQEVLKKLNKTPLDFAAAPEKIKIKVDTKLNVSLWGIPVSIPYVYDTNLKEMTAPAPQG